MINIDFFINYLFIGLLIEFVVLVLFTNNKTNKRIKQWLGDGTATAFFLSLWVLWLPYIVGIYLFKEIVGGKQ
jgi:hypothetical protein